MIYRWARRAGLNDAEAADVSQEVLTALVSQIGESGYSPDRGRFRDWLRGIAVHKATDLLRRRGRQITSQESGWFDRAVDHADSARFWELEYDRLLVERALEIMRTDFEETSWRACWEHLVGDRPAADVGHELGLSEGAVYAAKSRILKRLRQELKDLLD